VPVFNEVIYGVKTKKITIFFGKTAFAREIAG
jgi:hypothetical protein